MSKKTIAIILVILGTCSFTFGTIILKKVRHGEVTIQKAQGGVDIVKGASKLSPYSKGAGKLITKPIQKKIDEGKAEASSYKVLGFWLRIAGAILLLFGAALYFLKAKKKP